MHPTSLWDLFRSDKPTKCMSSLGLLGKPQHTVERVLSGWYLRLTLMPREVIKRLKLPGGSFF